MVLPGTPSQPQKALKLKKTTFWGDFQLKTAPHRRFGGSGVAEIFIFLSSNKKCSLFVKKLFFYLSPTKSYGAPQKNYQNRLCSIFWHHSAFLIFIHFFKISKSHKISLRVSPAEFSDESMIFEINHPLVRNFKFRSGATASTFYRVLKV